MVSVGTRETIRGKNGLGSLGVLSACEGGGILNVKQFTQDRQFTFKKIEGLTQSLDLDLDFPSTP